MTCHLVSRTLCTNLSSCLPSCKRTWCAVCRSQSLRFFVLSLTHPQPKARLNPVCLFFWKKEILIISSTIHQTDTSSWNFFDLCLNGTQHTKSLTQILTHYWLSILRLDRHPCAWAKMSLATCAKKWEAATSLSCKVSFWRIAHIRSQCIVE